MELIEYSLLDQTYEKYWEESMSQKKANSSRSRKDIYNPSSRRDKGSIE